MGVTGVKSCPVLMPPGGHGRHLQGGQVGRAVLITYLGGGERRLPVDGAVDRGAGVVAEGDRPDGNGVGPRVPSALRQMLVAIR